MKTVYLGGQPIRLDPKQAIGKGGEADVFQLGPDQAIKIFKPSNHPDFDGQPLAQAAANHRLNEHQQKLPAFPKGLPKGVITPRELITNQTGQWIHGYAMPLVAPAEPLLRYGDRGWRQTGVNAQDVVSIFRTLHATVSGIHRAGVVIGDFNDLNVLVKGAEPYLIDADSWQFGPYYCTVFTPRFTDPLLLDQNLNLARSFNADSDWYAYGVMLMQSLLYVDPYGGVYRPKDPANRLTQPQRPLKRVTIFHPEVRYPKPAIPYGLLPDDLLDRFQKLFARDVRGPFPLDLIENLYWTKCRNCSTEHARPICPVCALVPAAAVKQTITRRGSVTATTTFRTSGTILAAVQDGHLRWLYHERDQFRREEGEVVASGQLDPQMRYRIGGQVTVLAKADRAVVFRPNQPTQVVGTDSFGLLPQIDANDRHYYWITGGQLFRQGKWDAEQIGDVLARQTLFWVGQAFGFGFYRAGELQQAFVFDAERRGINDQVKLPRIKGQLVDATAVFSTERCWFFWSAKENGRLINHAVIVRRSGEVEAVADAPAGDNSWLGTIRGKCVSGSFLLAATDDGVVRVEPDNGQITTTRTYPDTEPFVDSSVQLFAGTDGLYVVTRKEITRLTIK